MQDKENKHTPSTAYVSSRLGLASPAFQTPARSGHKSAQHGSKSAHACRDANTHSTPSVGTALTHVTPSVAGGEQPTPSSGADLARTRIPVQPAHAEAACAALQGSAQSRKVLADAEVSHACLPQSLCEHVEQCLLTLQQSHDSHFLQLR